MDALEGGHDSRAAVNLHNNEAGRLVRYDTFSGVTPFFLPPLTAFLKFNTFVNPFITQLMKESLSLFIYFPSGLYARALIREKKVVPDISMSN